MACNTSSNITSGVASLNALKNTSRLVITIPQSISGLVAVGDVIRYDALNGYYTWSSANGLSNSEVVGIVESINPDNSRNVVVYGSINLPDNTLIFSNEDTTGAGGGNDVFFLSDVQFGRLQNIAPTGANSVIKSVYQVAPHGSYTGLVINNIGYALGGSNVASLTPTNIGVGTLHHYISIGTNDDLEVYKVSPRIVTAADYKDPKITLDKSIYPRYYEKYALTLGGYYELVLEPSAPVFAGMIDAAQQNTYFVYKDFISSECTLREVDVLNNKLTVIKDFSVSHRRNELLSGYYWLQRGSVWRGSTDFTLNDFAYLLRQIYFSVDLATVNIPALTVYTSGGQATIFTDATGTKNFRAATPINNIGINFIINVYGGVSALNLNQNSFVEQMRITSLTVNETDINQLLLDLENRLSYLESRLTM